MTLACPKSLERLAHDVDDALADVPVTLAKSVKHSLRPAVTGAADDDELGVGNLRGREGLKQALTCASKSRSDSNMSQSTRPRRYGNFCKPRKRCA